MANYRISIDTASLGRRVGPWRDVKARLPQHGATRRLADSTSLSIESAAIAFVVTLGGFLRDQHESQRQWADYEFTAIAPSPANTTDSTTASTMPPPGPYPAPVYIHLPGRGTALVSDPIDHALLTIDMQARLADEAYQLPKQLQASAPHVLRAVNHGRLVFNGMVVGLRSDPLPPGPTPVPPIALHVARFFDAQCSNEMCTLRIVHRETGEEFDPRVQLLTNARGHLRTLAESTLADCVGISTIAFTADDQLVLVRQTSRNTASAGLLAPSGSGSLDLRDLGPGASTAQSLQEILRRGMERELREETGVRQDEIAATRISGFARWLERGAKPEFFAITKLNVTAKDLEQRRHEPLYSGGTFTMSVDLPLLTQELSDGAGILDAPSLPARVRADGSLPLLLALRAAARSQKPAASS